MKQLVPWLATFFFGCAVFLAGKVLQTLRAAGSVAEESRDGSRERAAALKLIQDKEPGHGQRPPIIALRGQGQGMQKQGN